MLVECRAPDGLSLMGRSRALIQPAAVLFVAGAATGRSMRLGLPGPAKGKIRLLTMTVQVWGTQPMIPNGQWIPPLRTIGCSPTQCSARGKRSRWWLTRKDRIRLAMAAGGGISRLTLVSPVDEVTHPEIQELLSEHVKELVRLVADHHASAVQLLESMDANAMERMVLDASDPIDRAFYDQPQFLAEYRVALAEGFGQEGRGYVRDTIMAMSPWPMNWTSIRCPVQVMFGAEDRTHSPDLEVSLAQRISEACAAMSWQEQVAHCYGAIRNWS